MTDAVPRYRLATRTDHPMAADVLAEIEVAIEERIDLWSRLAADETVSGSVRAMMRYRLQQVAALPVAGGAEKLWKWCDG